MGFELRHSQIQRLTHGVFDVLIIGGGINGAVAAAALSAKGVKVALIDKGDFAACTSQESSNLIWGGIKYMETFEFALVRRLCASRNRLLKSYPSRIQEIRFLTTLSKGFRHRPLTLWLGGWLYWLLGAGFTRPPVLLSTQQIQAQEKLINLANSSGGFEYSDAYLPDNDARFVFNFIRSAMDRGCVAANYMESLSSLRTDDHLWSTRARDVVTGTEHTLKSTVLINAAGPFVDALNRLNRQSTEHHHVFSKGIHLIVEQITPRRRVLAFFADDGRLFFAIPLGPRTCIGTTDTRVDDPSASISDADRQFVLDNINKRLNLAKPLSRHDIIAERCGVRPLVVKGDAEATTADWLHLSRKHVIEVNPGDAHLSLFGGKLTDCLNIGEEVGRTVKALGLAITEPHHPWYGEPAAALRAEFLRQAAAIQLDSHTAPGATDKLSNRLWRRYGARAMDLLAAIRQDAAQADVLIAGTDYIRCEIEEAANREMVVRLEDFLRRRSELAQIMRQETLRNDPGVMEACTILFGTQAREKFAEYFHDDPPDIPWS